MRRLGLAVLVLVAVATVVWAATLEPRTGLSIPQRGDLNWDANARAIWTKTLEDGGFLDLPGTWTAEQIFSAATQYGTCPDTIVDAQMAVCSASNDIHSFAVWSDNGAGGWLQRFVVENTAGGGGVIDVNFRNATVNYGSDDPAVSANAVSAFFFSPITTAAYDIIRAYDDGQGASGSKTIVIGNQGYITSFGRGKASQIFKICDFSDQTAANCRFILTEDGVMLWGGGTSQDTQLGRISADVLGTPDTFRVGAFNRNVPQAVTVADNGNGGTAAAATLTPTATYINVTCNDAQGCDITMSETSMVDGTALQITNVSSNTTNFADSSGVSELAGAFAAGQWDTIAMRYVTDRWVETGRSNN
jgi:hypothetical protein